jgi:sugar lactone lactonase YvrE
MSGASSVVTLIVGLSFPEAPRWRDGMLWFSDIHAHSVNRITPDGAVVRVARIDDRASGLGFLPNGDPLVVSMLDRRLIAIDSGGGARMHADLAHLSGQFINDMAVDARGRAYVGSRNGGAAASASDSLLLVQADGAARTIQHGMVTPNGAVITPDGLSLIVAEPAVGRLNRFAIGPDGGLSGREIICELPGRHIDGICRDAAGHFWAGGGVGGLLRIAVDGALLRVIDFPGRMVLACALGGPDGKTLYLATTDLCLLDNLARIGFDRALDGEVNSLGRIEAMQVEIPGQDFE